MPLNGKSRKTPTSWAQIRLISTKASLGRCISKTNWLYKWPTVVFMWDCEYFWIITWRFSSLHLGLFIFLFSLANSGVLPHIAGSDTALWIEPTSKPASHSDSCVFHYNTVNSMGYFRFQLNVAVILSLNPLFALALWFMCILDLCTPSKTEDITHNALFFHPHAGHGDQEYAVPCDRIRQEWGNLW